MYTPLKDEVDRESSHGGEDYESLLAESRIQRKSSNRRTFLLMILGVPVASFFLIGFGVWLGRFWFANANDICPRHVQRYCTYFFRNKYKQNWVANYFVAPVLKEVDTSLHTVTFNGSLLKTNAYRQDAGPEVDAAWDALGVGCEFV